MKCYYHNDLDGRCAGSIVYNFIDELLRKAENLEMIEIDYKDNINVDVIEKDEQLYIVDFSFKPEVMEKVLQKTNNIIWIDHHKTADEYKYSQEIKGLRITENKKYSGCELTWMFFYPNEKIPTFVKLIGDRDKWAWKFGRETALFNQGIKICPHQPQDKIWDELFDVERVRRIQEDGIICEKFRDSFCKDYVDSYGFETEFEGHKCFALGIYMFGSEAFGKRFNQYDICLSFVYLGDKWTIGLYSEKIDVSVIAKKYGGGGHKGASGFVSDSLPFKKASVL
uniref:Putative DHH phosphatase family protein n=1 Tax=viral metagenome TaxID=1070528 RepID=A0A6H1ZBS6_9ZZZZ